MSKERPAIVNELLNGPYPCCLTTLAGDGFPYSVTVWCGPLAAGLVGVNAAEGRWLRNLRRDPRVSAHVIDTADILRYVSVQGRVVEIAADEDYAHIDSLSRVYEGRDYAYSRPHDTARFRVAIEPQRIRTLDLSGP